MLLKIPENPKSSFLSCSDININYLIENDQKTLNSSLRIYNLLHAIRSGCPVS